MSQLTKVEPTHWLKAKYFYSYLGKCNIGEQGCEDISKEKWEYLTVLNLGTTAHIQDRTRSEIRDANIFARHTGNSWLTWDLVIKLIWRREQHWRSGMPISQQCKLEITGYPQLRFIYLILSQKQHRSWGVCLPEWSKMATINQIQSWYMNK